MVPFSSRQVLDAWAGYQGLDPVVRSVTLLRMAYPEVDEEAALNAPLGWREERLLELYQAMFGAVIEASATCPRCKSALRYTLDIDQVRSEMIRPLDAPPQIEVGGYLVRFRLPTSADQLAVSGAGFIQQAFHWLLRRCVLEVRGGSEASVSTTELTHHPERLPLETITALTAHMEALDPGADLWFSLECVDCEHRWEVALDAGSMLWRAIDGTARRLMDEVFELGGHFGWTEDEVMRVSPWRRRYYLEKL